jgi:hypothetical protein
MDFLADVWVTCPVCEGRRFNRETLQVRFKGKNIRDVLEMDVQEALQHFSEIPKIAPMLQTLHDVGLDYLKLGQPSPTLSGGEAQRIKLARELSKRQTGKTLYLLGTDSPEVTAYPLEGAGSNAEKLAWLGVSFDPAANAAGGPLLSQAQSKVALYVVPTDEELMIARHTLNVLRTHGAEMSMEKSA